MARSNLKVYTLDQVVTKLVGGMGTASRQQFEHKLEMAVLGRLVKAARLEQDWTQEQLGKRVGVQKAQISKIENSAHHAQVDTLIRIFKALKADVRIQVKLNGKTLEA